MIKIAILSITENGQILGETIKEILLNKDSRISEIAHFHKNVKTNLNIAFNEYDAIIGIMATGIMIRSIIPLLKTKYEDPAVIIIDEKCQNIISLLSGHLGGANALTSALSKYLLANPVITTSTDVNNVIGVDEIIRKYYFEIIDGDKIVEFNKVIILGEKIKIFSKADISYLKTTEILKSYEIIDNISDLTEYTLDNQFNNIKNDEILFIYEDKYILAKISKIVMGIGARKSIAEKKVLNAITKACINLEFDVSRINSFATVEIKKDEIGIINTVKKLNKDLNIVSLNQIKEEMKTPKANMFSHSDFVYKKFGVGSVCEPVATIQAGLESDLIFKKTSYDGVTIAVAISKN
jgi:cobalt-precorrin 5A hydrolase